jgi:hypothetical protein
MCAQPRLRVLLSAYACCPGVGSEPEVGWAFASAMASHHDVRVLTRAAHRERIERALRERPVEGLRFLYYDPPDILRWGRSGGPRMQAHAYVWQKAAGSLLRAWHRDIGFDVAQHVTFAKYWAPSCLARTGIPYLFGPVGGAELTPPSLRGCLPVKGWAADWIKRLVSRAAERDPAVRRTVRNAALCLGSTPETVARLEGMGAARAECLTQVGIGGGETRRPPEIAPAAGSSASAAFYSGRDFIWAWMPLHAPRPPARNTGSWATDRREDSWNKRRPGIRSLKRSLLWGTLPP